jgi:hypothetical protein
MMSVAAQHDDWGNTALITYGTIATQSWEIPTGPNSTGTPLTLIRGAVTDPLYSESPSRLLPLWRRSTIPPGL